MWWHGSGKLECERWSTPAFSSRRIRAGYRAKKLSTQEKLPETYIVDCKHCGARKASIRHYRIIRLRPPGVVYLSRSRKSLGACWLT
jgi:hypothetical protein